MKEKIQLHASSHFFRILKQLPDICSSLFTKIEYPKSEFEFELRTGSWPFLTGNSAVCFIFLQVFINQLIRKNVEGIPEGIDFNAVAEKR